MTSKIEYLFWPGELAARAVEHVGATALRVMQGIPVAFDSRRRGQELEENYICNELDTLTRDLRDNLHKPEVVRLDARRIADLTWTDYRQRVEGGEWRSPEYIAQVARNLADCGVPAVAILETFKEIDTMHEPPTVQLTALPRQLTMME